MLMGTTCGASAPEGRRTVAQGVSPGNKPPSARSPGGAEETGPARLRRPSGAECPAGGPPPRAYALGYRPPPLRGWSLTAFAQSFVGCLHTPRRRRAHGVLRPASGGALMAFKADSAASRTGTL